MTPKFCFCTMLRSSVILTSICFILSFETSYAKDACPPVQEGQMVPAEACDNKTCRSVSNVELQNMVPMKAYTWSSVNNKLIEFCPSSFNTTTQADQYNPDNIKVTIVTTGSCGEKCDEKYTITKTFDSPKDPCNENLGNFNLNENGQSFASCYALFVPNGPAIYRTCRIDPNPSYPGQAFAYFTVQLPVNGDCKRDRKALLDFLKTYPVDLKNIVPECPCLD